MHRPPRALVHVERRGVQYADGHRGVRDGRRCERERKRCCGRRLGGETTDAIVDATSSEAEGGGSDATAADVDPDVHLDAGTDTGADASDAIADSGPLAS